MHEGQTVYLKTGPYGRYVQLGDGEGDTKPKRISVPKSIDPVSLQEAKQLLDLPRLIGTHPETGKPIAAGIGRFGPYVVHDGVFASLKGGDDVFVVDLERGMELLAAKKAGSRALRVLGEHPLGGGSVEVRQGRYGPYVKYKKLNATLGKDQSPETVSLEEALELLAAKEAGGVRRRRRKAGR